MINNILVFEDELYDNFYPLAYTRPVFELRSGIYSLLEKIVYRFPKSHISLVMRDSLKGVSTPKYPNVPINIINASGGTLLINGRTIWDDRELPFFPDGEDRDFMLVSKGNVVCAYLGNENLNSIKEIYDDIIDQEQMISALKKKVSVREVDVDMVSFPWDLIKHNKAQLQKDFIYAKSAGIIKGDIHDSAVLYDEGNIFIDRNSEIMAHCILDARKGPIYIGADVLVKAGSYIEGPTYVGDGTIVSKGYLREGSSVGPHCRVGGEIEESIIQGYSNKNHEGFLGHSYLGEWVNLGALTTTSDLKNNYSEVKVKYGSYEVNTGMQFLGSIIGDHTKTGIGTLLTTGSIIGIGCNLFGGGVFPKNVSSFKWGSTTSIEPHNFEKFVATATAVTKRRDKTLSVINIELLDALYKGFKH